MWCLKEQLLSKDTVKKVQKEELIKQPPPLWIDRDPRFQKWCLIYQSLLKELPFA